VSRAPTEQSFRPGRVGPDRRRIAGPPRPLLDRDEAAGHPLDGGDHLADGCTPARADVHDRRLAAAREQVERPKVGLGQIEDVDVVPDGGPVRGRIVRAVDEDGSAEAGRRAEDDRQEVRRALPVLARQAVMGRSGCVEVPE
jgi:hypothetical protein